MTEREWMESLRERLDPGLKGLWHGEVAVGVEASKRLAYSHEVLSYSTHNEAKIRESCYQTDILVVDRHADGSWIPRVVLELKLGAVSTHDALTYSTKASTHKHIHPYLRYGIAIGNWGESIMPWRLLKHGAYFDFMMIQRDLTPTQREWELLTDTLTSEVQASRELQRLLSRSGRSSQNAQLIHRKLVVK